VLDEEIHFLDQPQVFHCQELNFVEEDHFPEALAFV
jgi:hypothetical protein